MMLRHSTRRKLRLLLLLNKLFLRRKLSVLLLLYKLLLNLSLPKLSLALRLEVAIRRLHLGRSRGCRAWY